MRANKFGERYCHTADEARRIIDNLENGWDVYVAQFDDADGEFQATAEIAENVSGDIVCYIEAPTLEQVLTIIKELKLSGAEG